LPFSPQQNELLPLLEPPLEEPPLEEPPLDEPPLEEPPLEEPPLLDPPLEPPLLLLHANPTKEMERRAMTTLDRMGRYLVGMKRARKERSRAGHAAPVPPFEG
jgi:hypothetical protein